MLGPTLSLALGMKDGHVPTLWLLPYIFPDCTTVDVLGVNYACDMKVCSASIGFI